jgi:hypothetical protein
LGARTDRNKPWMNAAPSETTKGSALAHRKPSLLKSENKAKEKISQEATLSEREDVLPSLAFCCGLD